MKMFVWMACGLLLCNAQAADQTDVFQRARQNGLTASRTLEKCRLNMNAWLQAKDQESGLLPKYLPASPNYRVTDPLYQVKDTAADLYPFLVLTSYFIDPGLYHGYMHEFLRQEIRLTTGRDGLTRDAYFQPFRINEQNLTYHIFGASEYVKDGLTPVVELLGRTPWFYRMQELTDAIMKNAPISSVFGSLPSGSAEVNGEMLQTLCRLYGLTGDEKYLSSAERIADAYIFQVFPFNYGLPAHEWDFESHTGADYLQLRDHGCEIISGLALLFAIERDEIRERGSTYYGPIKAMLNKIAQVRNQDGQFPNRIKCSDLSVLNSGLNDNWGYLYTAWWDFYLATGETAYRDIIEHALQSLHNYHNVSWEGNFGADGYADAIEGCLEMVNRIPNDTALDWIETEIVRMQEKQTPEGHIEAWYGDGNWNRTNLMYVFYKTQGCYLQDWSPHTHLGAIRRGDSLFIDVSVQKSWQGRLLFDQQRHRTFFQFKQNYARINEFPEWYTVEPTRLYRVIDALTHVERTFLGAELIRGLDVSMKKNSRIQLVVLPVK